MLNSKLVYEMLTNKQKEKGISLAPELADRLANLLALNALLINKRNVRPITAYINSHPHI